MTTLVGNDPKASHDKTTCECVKSPYRKSASAIKDRIWQVDYIRLNQRVRVRSKVVEACQQEEIPDPRLSRQKWKYPDMAKLTCIQTISDQSV